VSKLKLWYFLKANLIVTFKQFPMLVFAIVVTPVLLGLFLSFSSSSMFTPTVEPPKISVYWDNLDKSAIGEHLDDSIAQLEKEDIVVREQDRQDASVIISVPQNFGEDLETNYDRDAGDQMPAIAITTEKDDAASDAVIIRQIMDSVMEPILTSIDLAELTTDAGENKELAQEIQAAVASKLTQQKAVTKEHVGVNALSSTQFYAINSIGFMLVLIFSNLLIADTKDSLQALNKRIRLLPLKVSEQVWFTKLTNLIVYASLILLGMLVWWLYDRSTFSGNFLYYLLIILCQLVLVLGASGLISSFISERAASSITGLISIVWIALSGFIPLEKYSASPFFEALQHNPIRRLFIDPYFEVQQFNTLSNSWLVIGGLALVGVILSMIQTVVLKRKEEY